MLKEDSLVPSAELKINNLDPNPVTATIEPLVLNAIAWKLLIDLSYLVQTASLFEPLWSAIRPYEVVGVVEERVSWEEVVEPV